MPSHLNIMQTDLRANTQKYTKAILQLAAKHRFRYTDKCEKNMNLIKREEVDGRINETREVA